MPKRKASEISKSPSARGDDEKLNAARTQCATFLNMIALEPHKRYSRVGKEIETLIYKSIRNTTDYTFHLTAVLEKDRVQLLLINKLVERAETMPLENTIECMGQFKGLVFHVRYHLHHFACGNIMVRFDGPHIEDEHEPRAVINVSAVIV
jgi:hypothetical protein